MGSNCTHRSAQRLAADRAAVVVYPDARQAAQDVVGRAHNFRAPLTPRRRRTFRLQIWIVARCERFKPKTTSPPQSSQGRSIGTSSESSTITPWSFSKRHCAAETWHSRRRGWLTAWSLRRSHAASPTVRGCGCSISRTSTASRYHSVRTPTRVLRSRMRGTRRGTRSAYSSYVAPNRSRSNRSS